MIDGNYIGVTDQRVCKGQAPRLHLHWHLLETSLLQTNRKISDRNRNRFCCSPLSDHPSLYSFKNIIHRTPSWNPQIREKPFLLDKFQIGREEKLVGPGKQADSNAGVDEGLNLQKWQFLHCSLPQT